VLFCSKSILIFIGNSLVFGELSLQFFDLIGFIIKLSPETVILLALHKFLISSLGFVLFIKVLDAFFLF
jgi:hypothetical protein